MWQATSYFFCGIISESITYELIWHLGRNFIDFKYFSSFTDFANMYDVIVFLSLICLFIGFLHISYYVLVVFSDQDGIDNDCNIWKTIVPDQSFLQVFTCFHLYFVPSVHCSFRPLLVVTEQLLLFKSICTAKLAYAKLTYLHRTYT